MKKKTKCIGTRLQVQCPTSTARLLNQIAELQNQPVSQVVRNALIEWVRENATKEIQTYNYLKEEEKENAE